MLFLAGWRRLLGGGARVEAVVGKEFSDSVSETFKLPPGLSVTRASRLVSSPIGQVVPFVDCAYGATASSPSLEGETTLPLSTHPGI